MLIIVEGPDLSGKSTFIEQQLIPTIKRLSPGDTIEVLNKGPATKNAMDEYEAPLLDYRPGRGKTIICNRWHWGEMIYPAVVGRPSRIDATDFWHIEQFLSARGAICITLTADVTTLEQRWDVRGDDYIKCEWLGALVDGFSAVRSEAMINTIVLTPKYSNAASASIVVQSALSRETLTSRLNKFVTYVGSTHPTTLLFGDVRGVKGIPNDPKQPAFQTRKNSSGYFTVNTIVQHMPLVHKMIGLANACDVDNPIALWEALRRPRVVALGVQAYTRLRDSDIPHLEMVQHPQYVRRFRAGEKQQYADEIMKAAGLS